MFPWFKKKEESIHLKEKARDALIDIDFRA